MKYVLMFIDDEARYAAAPKEEIEASYAKIGEWFEGIAKKGQMAGGEELQPMKTATTVRRNGQGHVITDGPFMEAKETIGGFAIVDVESLDEAIELAKSWPAGAAVEVRPIVDHSTDGRM